MTDQHPNPMYPNFPPRLPRKGQMKKILYCKVDELKEVAMGTPDDLAENGGKWTSALGRLFQGKSTQTIIIKHEHGTEESYYLKDIE